MRSGIVVVCLVLQAVAVSALRAQGTPKSDSEKSPAVEIADYTKAFDMLIELGLPDAAGATYVELELHPMRADGEEDEETVRQAAIQRQLMMQQRGALGLKTKGNAWMLPGEDDGRRTFLIKGGKGIQVSKQPKRNKLLSALAGPRKAPKGGGQAGDWKEVDLDKDLEQIFEALEKASKDGQTFDADTWGYSDTAAAASSDLLVLACQMHRAGHKEQGAKLAQKILAMVPNPVKVIDAVVDSLGQRVYKDHVDRFFETKDWAAFDIGLKQTIERYPRGWSQRIGVTLLSAKVEERVKGLQPKLAKLDGVTPDAKLVQKLDDLLEFEETVVVTPADCWLINLKLPEARANSGAAAERRAAESSQQEWLKSLCAEGMDGLIAAVTAVADEALIPVRMSEYSGGYSRNDFTDYGFSFGSTPSLEDMALTQYSGLNRPCSRSEIASIIVLAALPEGLDDFSGMSPQDLQASAYDWWKEHHDDSQSELANHFLEVGGSSQRNVAAEALIETGKEDDAKLVEEYILSNQLTSSLVMVETYLKARRGKAEKFFKEYSTLLKDQAASGEIDSWYFRSGGVDGHVKRLSVFVNEVKPEKVLADLESGKMSPNDAITMLQAASEDKFAEYLPVLISAIRKQDDFEKRVTSMGSLIVWSGEVQGGKLGEPSVWASDSGIERLMAKSKDDWEFFLNEETTEADDKSDSEKSNAPSRRHHAAWVMEILYFTGRSYAIEALNEAVGYEEGWEILLRRGKGFVKTGELEDFPSASLVKDRRREAIRKELKTLGAMEIVDYFKERTIPEKLAWDGIMEGFGEDVPAGVKEIQSIVTKFDYASATDLDQGLKDQLEAAARNKKLGQELNEALMEVMMKNAGAMADVVPILYGSESPGRGAQLRVWKGDNIVNWKRQVVPPEAFVKVKDGDAEKLAGISLYEDGEYEAATVYEPAEDVESERKKMEEIAKKMKEFVEKGATLQVIFFAETADNLNNPPVPDEAP